MIARRRSIYRGPRRGHPSGPETDHDDRRFPGAYLGADTPERPWPAGEAARAHQPTPLTAEGLLEKMDAAGVARAILVPPSWEGDRNDIVLAAAHRYPERFAVMGRISLEAPESRAEFLPLTRTDGMLGLRFTFHTEKQQKLLTSGAADWLWPAAAAAGVPLMVHAPHSLRLSVFKWRAAQLCLSVGEAARRQPERPRGYSLD